MFCKTYKKENNQNYSFAKKTKKKLIYYNNVCLMYMRFCQFIMYKEQIFHKINKKTEI